MTALLDRIGLPGDEKSWAALGFDLEGGRMRIGGISCVVGVQPSWGFAGAHADPSVLGIAELVSGDVTGGAHPNGVSFVDHIVYWVPDLDAAVAGLDDVLATEPRRRFHPRGPAGPEMAFYRVGEAFIEVVAAGGQPPMLAGIAFGAPDLDATVAAVRAAGGPISDPKPAVQGGRIASVWTGHVGWGVAIMEPKQRS
ncbi:VOC family protein [Nocardia pseudobrasiliensis]|uniref:Glyoxalase/bleomycin resistance protein/dioxygenase superfamily protein n=1 Tax=Nocardia pseudobrasiliensis TaxID=45979 RepID=A0A370HZF5_9NOCA|nr:VOC family protein [Nocardia pseudobrasiliensis]RDI63700.1 glyoxalase/bleomycin resistance protein/dioxygenase superfamily protein [Nocardia pseudobrasiliensis]